MFIVALFIIAQNWKQPRYPLMDEWLNKTAVCPHHGTLPSNKKERTIETYINLDKSPENYAE